MVVVFHRASEGSAYPIGHRNTICRDFRVWMQNQYYPLGSSASRGPLMQPSKLMGILRSRKKRGRYQRPFNSPF
jgi:hypothetical protein